METNLDEADRHERARSWNDETLHKPHGVIHPRVQKVGPDHFTGRNALDRRTHP